jgi:hypothetical protein
MVHCYFIKHDHAYNLAIINPIFTFMKLDYKMHISSRRKNGSVSLAKPDDKYVGNLKFIRTSHVKRNFRRSNHVLIS